MGRNYKFKCIKESFQKELFYKASDILLDRHKVGLDIFTSGGKSIISGELIYFIEEKLGRDAKVLVVTNTSVWDNLLITYTSDRVGLNRDNLYFVSNAKLSTGKSLISEVSKLGKNLVNDIDIIISDECHSLFGANISKEIDKAKDFIYSKYVIAMTATRINGVAGIDSLFNLIGDENCVTYNTNDAVHDDVINKINVAIAQLRAESDYTDIANSLYKLNSKSVSKFIKQVKYLELKDLSVVIQKNIEREIKYRGQSICKLDATNGARVLAFFNRIEDISNIKDDLISAVRGLYGKDINIRFIEYTSKSNTSDVEAALEILSNKNNSLVENTVDIIATCERGAESFHPANVQLGLIFGETASLRKLIQTLGRFVNLRKYQPESPLIVRFVTFKNNNNRYTIFDGRRSLDDRSNSISEISQYFNDKVDDIQVMLADFKDSIDIHATPLDESIIDEINSLEGLSFITKDCDELFDYIQRNLKVIDMDIYKGGYAGNVEKFLKVRQNEASKHNDKEYLDKKYFTKYQTVRQITMNCNKSFKNKDKLNKFEQLEYRIYLSEKDSPYDMTNIKTLYDCIQDEKYTVDAPILSVETENPSSYSGFSRKAVNITDAYMQGLVTPSGSILIRNNKEMLLKIYDKYIRDTIHAFNAKIPLTVSKDDAVNFQLLQLIIFAKRLKQVKDKQLKLDAKELNENKARLVAAYKYIEVYLNRLRRSSEKGGKEDILISNILYIVTDGYAGNIINEMNNSKYDNVYYYAIIMSLIRNNFSTAVSERVYKWAYSRYNRAVKYSKTDEQIVRSISFGEYTPEQLIKTYVESSSDMVLIADIANQASLKSIERSTLKKLHKLNDYGMIPKKFRSSANIKTALNFVV